MIPTEDREQQRQKVDELKGFLEGLQAFNTPGKLKNFSKSVLEIQGHVPTFDLIKQIEDLNGLVQELTALTGYLGTAAAVLPPQDPWRAQMETMRSEWRAKLMDPSARSAADFRQKIIRTLQKVKEDYKSAYFNLHKKARLGVNEDGKKKELLKDARLESLKKLAGVSLLPHSNLTELQTRLAKFQPCFTLVKDDLDSSFVRAGEAARLSPLLPPQPAIEPTHSPSKAIINLVRRDFINASARISHLMIMSRVRCSGPRRQSKLVSSVYHRGVDGASIGLATQRACLSSGSMRPGGSSLKVGSLSMSLASSHRRYSW